MKAVDELRNEIIYDLLHGEYQRHVNDEDFHFSTRLTSLMYEYLADEKEWKEEIWLDDCLVTRITYSGNRFNIWGVVIYGISGQRNQLTYPFFNSIEHEKGKMLRYELYFGEDRRLNFSDFFNDQGTWDDDFYSDHTWDIRERSWLYHVLK